MSTSKIACVVLWLLTTKHVCSSAPLYLRQTPVADIASNGIHIYKCHFNQIVKKCQWKSKNVTIKPDKSGLNYQDGKRGFNTTDCSLEGSKALDNATIMCEGSVMPIKMKVNISKGYKIQLDCKGEELDRCSWKRNGSIIDVRGRYKFVNQSCSIEISNISATDITLWQCEQKATDSRITSDIYNIYTLREYGSTDNETATTTSTDDTIEPQKLNSLTLALATSGCVVLVLTAALLYIMCSRHKFTNKGVNTKETEEYDDSPMLQHTLKGSLFHVTQPIYANVTQDSIITPSIQSQSTSLYETLAHNKNNSLEEVKEVIYTEVIISKTNSAEHFTKIKDCRDKEIYATIAHKPINKNATNN